MHPLTLSGMQNSKRKGYTMTSKECNHLEDNAITTLIAVSDWLLNLTIEKRQNESHYEKGHETPR